LAALCAGVAAKVLKAVAGLLKDEVFSCWADNKVLFLAVALDANKRYPAAEVETFQQKLARQKAKAAFFVSSCKGIVTKWCATNSVTYDDSFMNFLTELAVRAMKMGITA